MAGTQNERGRAGRSGNIIVLLFSSIESFTQLVAPIRSHHMHGPFYGGYTMAPLLYHVTGGVQRMGSEGKYNALMYS